MALSAAEGIKEYPVVLYTQKAYQIPSVKAIYYKIGEEGIFLWTQVEKETREVRDGLYRIEASLEETFPDILFDFFIFAAQDASELLSEFKKINDGRFKSPPDSSWHQ